MIIGLAGKMGSGKDAAARIIATLDYIYRNESYGGNIADIFHDRGWTWESIVSCPINEFPFFQNYRVRRFSFNLKRIVGILTGFTPEELELPSIKDMVLGREWDTENPIHTYTMREFMQRVGTEALRNVVHPGVHVNSLMCEYSDNQDWIIPDVRFTNEGDAIQTRGGIIIRLNRPGLPTNSSTHQSETELDNYPGFFSVINNDGSIEDLANKLSQAIFFRKIHKIKS